MSSTQQEQIARRRERGMLEDLRVSPLDSHRVFGRFAVRSGSGSTYEVTIRTSSGLANTCTCPDYRTNEIGTCKHVEAVMRKVRAPRNRPLVLAFERAPNPVDIYLHYGAEREIRVLRPAGFERRLPEIAKLLERYFDSEGRLRGNPQRQFPAVRELLAATGDVRISSDVDQHVAELRELARRRDEREEWLRRFAAGERIGVTRVPLYPYQERGALHLALNGRAVLADDMGLGKTVQAIAACEFLRRERGTRRALIVCPASLKHQWAKEILRFTGETAAVVAGNAMERKAIYEARCSYTILNYELTLRDLSVMVPLEPDILILDEAQRIKNWRAKTADVVKKVRSRYAFVLTGTPLENRLDDLYSVMQAVDPRLLGPLWKFNESFHVIDARNKVLGYKNLDVLRDRVAPVLLRRRKEEVLQDLPDRTVNVFFTEMTDSQLRHHKDAGSNVVRLLSIAKRRPLTPKEREILQMNFLKMRMSCDAAQLIDPKDRTPSPKLQELEKLVPELLEDGDRKIVLFSEWVKMLDLVGALLRKLKVGYEFLHGGVPTSKRGALLDRFAEDPNCRVLLSTEAGGVGLNLQSASCVINVDLPWNPAKLEQRIGRVHRHGQKKSVSVLNLVAQGSIEERMLELHEKKRSLYKGLIDADATQTEMALPTMSGLADLEVMKNLIDPEPSRIEPVMAAAADAAAASMQARPVETTGGAVPLPDDPGPQPAGAASAQPSTASEGPLAPSSPMPAGVAAPAEPTTAVAARLAEMFSPELGAALKSVLPLPGGVALVADASWVDAGRQARVAAAGRELGAEAILIDPAMLETLRRMLRPAGPARSADRADRAEEPLARRAREAREKAEARLKAALWLLDGALASDSVRAAHESMTSAVEALLASAGIEPPAAEGLLEAVYSKLVRSGRLQIGLVAGLSRGRDLANLAAAGASESIDLPTARAVADDARALCQAASAGADGAPGRA